MRLSAQRPYILALLLLSSGCGDDSSGKNPNEKATDTADNEGTDSDPAGEDTESESSTPNDGGTEETDDNDPPDLPDRCRLVTEPFGGEEIGRFEVSGEGDGREPDAAFSSDKESAVFIWAYFPSSGDENRRWSIQSAPLTVDTNNEDDLAKVSLGETTAVTTAEESRLAESPTVASRGDEYAVVFKDARYHTDCDPLDYTDCPRDLVYMQLDASGVPLDPEPIRLTESGHVILRPDIAELPEGGYVVTWLESETDGYKVKVMRVSTDGKPGEIFTLPDFADNNSEPSVAANKNVAVIVYASKRKLAIVGGVWSHDDEAPPDEVDVISDTHDSQQSPRIAAGKDGFMISWIAKLTGKNEVFLRPLDASGAASGDEQRGTWSDTPVAGSNLGWNGETFALVWESAKDNGTLDCAVGEEWCNEQVFGALVDTDGTVQSRAVLFSNDPNRSRNARIVWDGRGWTAIWQAWRDLRWQVFYGQMACD